MDFATALAGVSSSLTIVKQLRELDLSMDQAVHKAQLVNLMEQLAELRMQLIDAREEARDRDQEISRLSKFQEANLEGKVQVQGFFLDTFEDGTPRGDAYCPFCIEKKSGLFRLHSLEKPGRPDGCPNCRTEYRNAPSYAWDRS